MNRGELKKKIAHHILFRNPCLPTGGRPLKNLKIHTSENLQEIITGGVETNFFQPRIAAYFFWRAGGVRATVYTNV